MVFDKSGTNDFQSRNGCSYVIKMRHEWKNPFNLTLYGEISSYHILILLNEIDQNSIGWVKCYNNESASYFWKF
jgi:hypothetical protein